MEEKIHLTEDQMQDIERVATLATKLIFRELNFEFQKDYLEACIVEAIYNARK